MNILNSFKNISIFNGLDLKISNYIPILYSSSLSRNEIPKSKINKLSKPMSRFYEPKTVESDWYDWWDESLLFKGNKSKNNFSMLLPPPNITGSLHIGHALTLAVGDVLIRKNRMDGYNTEWIPGTDHAGIATQVVVERLIKNKENLTRHDLGREEFLKRVFKWKSERQSRIMEQTKSMGASLNWSKEFFTMDDSRSNYVNNTFIKMYNAGLIYRSNKMVNWCPELRSVISDIEVDWKDVNGEMYMIAYKIENSDEEIIVGTTRPETILADEAVAIHPDDEKYKKFHGKRVIAPFSGRTLPIVKDSELVDPNFGTGAVKITPAHDFSDFEAGKRHNLPIVNALNEDGTFNDKFGNKWRGLDRFVVRKNVIEELNAKGLYRGKNNHPMRIAYCSRTGDVLEPLLKAQWFVATDKLSKIALDHVKSEEIKMKSSEHIALWRNWLENPRDWCISRQLWWGHRIPAYRKSDSSNDNEWVVSRSRKEAVRKLGTDDIVQDEDVLDTWFSSGLLPLSATSDNDLNSSYPLSIMETGSDILFFWVARMSMLCGYLSGQAPFKEVLFHPMVRDSKGRKMSKSLGNVLDPMSVINGSTLEEMIDDKNFTFVSAKEKEFSKTEIKKSYPKGIQAFGADTMRLALIGYTEQTRQINLDFGRIQSCRFFLNKLWNGSKYVLEHLNDNEKNLSIELMTKDSLDSLPYIDKWILSRLYSTSKQIENGFNSNRLSIVSNSLINFLQDEYCNTYLEWIKSEGGYVAHSVLENWLRLSHPVIPFVTEEIWQRIPVKYRNINDRNKSSIMIASWTRLDKVMENQSIENEVEDILGLITNMRNIKQKRNLKNVSCNILIKNEPLKEIIKKEINPLQKLSGDKGLKIINSVPNSALNDELLYSDSNFSIFYSPDDLMNTSEQKPILSQAQIEKNKAKLQKKLNNLKKKISNPSYLKKAPKNVIDYDREKMKSISESLENLDI